MKVRFVSLSMVVALVAGLLWAVLPAAGQQQIPDRETRLREALAKPTPRLPNGKPDLTANWGEPDTIRYSYTLSDDGKTLIVGDRDAPELDSRAQPNFKARAANTSLRPKYKPEFQARQRELMHTASLNDPGLRCYPWGVPRIGAPTEIAHTPTTLYLMYTQEGTEAAEDPTDTFRVVPIGGTHNPEADLTPNGDSIAFWEGDTLVVDVVSLDPDTWLDGDGTFHSDALHVVERFTRKGDTLEYEVIVEDPKMFMEPFKPVRAGNRPRNSLGGIGSQTRIARPAGEHARPAYPCVERDHENKVNNDRF